MRHLLLLLVLVLAGATAAWAQPTAADRAARPIVLVPEALWDGIADTPRHGWVVVVRGERIEAVGPGATLAAPAGAERIDLAGATLIPGLIEGHAHLFLHPYNETLWDDQVLGEPFGYRMAEAVARSDPRRPGAAPGSARHEGRRAGTVSAPRACAGAYAVASAGSRWSQMPGRSRTCVCSFPAVAR